jgi:protein-S-isoprenylcysteine O-methyltransferase Ste14
VSVRNRLIEAEIAAAGSHAASQKFIWHLHDLRSEETTVVPFSFGKIALFVVLTLIFLCISRKALRNPHCHGFYRFFAFEGILFLVLLNHPFWFVEVYAPHQLVSWLLLSTSVVFVCQGLYMLRKVGGSEEREDAPENFAFENTTSLVTAGIYRYIRHPMYSSLLLLNWGAFFKHFSLPGLMAAVLTTVVLVVAGSIEEKENLAFFGPGYLEYRKTTKMFLPFVL